MARCSVLLVAAGFTVAIAAPTHVVHAAPAAPGASASPVSSNPLIERIVRQANLPALPRATYGPSAAAKQGAAPLRVLPQDPFHTLTTALPDLHATLGAMPATAPIALRSPGVAPPGSAPTKLPGTEGIAGDNFGRSVTPAGDMFDDGVSDVAVGAPYAIGPGSAVLGSVTFFYGTPTSSTPPTLIYGEAAFDGFGYSVAGVGDVNGDGYPDLLVGAPFHDIAANADAGKAYLFLGGPGGIATDPVWTFATGEAHAEVGYSVGWAGDVNNDGYDDWIIGAPGHTNGEAGEGAAYLFLGGPLPLAGAAAWSYEPNLAAATFGYSVGTAGDVNGDGYSDIIVGAPYVTGSFSQEGEASLFLGHAVKPSLTPDRTWFGGQASANFGTSVATAGDVNGDGYSDIIVGAPYYDDLNTNQGLAVVIHGGPLPLTYGFNDILEVNVTNAYFGTAVATAGDVNGDGFADVIVGATGILHATNQGSAYIYVGSNDGVIPLLYDGIVSPTAGELAGVSVSTMGSFYGSSYSDCWMGALGNTFGEAWALPGHPFPPGSDEVLAAQGYDPGYPFGLTAGATDINGDGYDDLLVGSYEASSDAPNSGIVRLYLGGPHPFQPAGPFPIDAPAPDWTFAGAAGEDFAWKLIGAGDLNGDGYEDFAASAPFHTNAQSAEGEAFVFYGSPTGPAGGPPWTMEGNQASELLGYSIGAGGDLNGDGYNDLVVGAPQGDKGLSGEGLAYVLLGSPSGVAHTPQIVLRGNQALAGFGSDCAIVGDINGDGIDDLVVGAEAYSEGESNEGHAFVYFGTPTGIHAVPDETLQINVAGAGFGFGVFRIGDVNGDGYADVAIGAPFVSDPENGEGELFVYYGSPAGLVQPAAWTLEGDQDGDNLGVFSISGADVNADGIADLVVGEPNSNLGATQGGRMRVFLGSTGGLATGAYIDQNSSTTGAQFGRATGGHADFDGDGYPDLYYGDPGLARLGANEGGAVVRLGNSIWFDARNPDRPIATRRADDTAPIAPGQRSDSKTAFRFKARGRSAAGRGRVRLEAEVKPQFTAFTPTGHVRSTWQPSGTISPGQGSTAPIDFAVNGLTAGTAYHWRARYDTHSPLFPFTPWFSTAQRSLTERHVTAAGGAALVDVTPPPLVPGTIALSPAAPNPSVGGATTLLAFAVPHAVQAHLALYDVRGRLVRTLFEGAAPAGRTAVAWDGTDASGRRAPAGAYFLRLSALGADVTEKLVRLP
jgi:hypothetical protein